jgi:four helix bundle protein
MQNFKELVVWQKGHGFTLKIYEITKEYPREEIFSLTTQIRRSAYSIPANIAEGCGRSTQKELANFLQISLGSANECEYFLLLSKDLKYLSEEQFCEMEREINLIKAMLIKLIAKVRL